MNPISSILRLAGSPKLKKIKISSSILKLAMMFIDYESESLPPSERMFEYGFAMSKLIKKEPCLILDVGCAARNNFLVSTLCFSKWEVCGIDIRDWTFKHRKFGYIKGDIRTIKMPVGSFDIISCISTLEHIGLASYYGITEENLDGDLEAMTHMRELLKVGGTLILTAPYKLNYTIRPGARIYGKKRIEILTEGFTIASKEVFAKSNNNWIRANEDIKMEGMICLELVKN